MKCAERVMFDLIMGHHVDLWDTEDYGTEVRALANGPRILGEQCTSS